MKLNKSIPFLLLLLFSILSLETNDRIAYAESNDPSPPLEEVYTQIGFKTVQEAVSEFEKHFKKDVKLPLKVPSIPFTHMFGRFWEDKEYNVNDFLGIEFINEKSPVNHYKIDIRPLKNKIIFKSRGHQTVYTLKDGQEAIYITERYSSLLVFEKDNWQYMLGINKGIANKVTPETLVEIADSIDYVHKNNWGCPESQ
ncbi:hypothetical protein CD798_17660 [Bacillaceae bacterium SAOS 7]|nr:hypothetical protein CD798_17660 [Bacillaceae bacterium SAOS 7]